MTKTNKDVSHVAVRETGATDLDAVLALYPLAFPEEDLRPVVRDLLTGPYGTLSLAAFDGADLVGHVLFSLCGTSRGATDMALLAPLGIVPSHQKCGLGGRIVRAGLERLRDTGVSHAFVFGDPGYYNRFGFEAERAVLPPYPIPEEWMQAWQSMKLVPDSSAVSGPLQLPAPWMHPELWAV